MKHFPRCTLFVILMLSASGLLAQIGFGLRGGVHLAKWALNDEAREQTGTDPESISGIVAAALLEIRLSDNLALQPELSFI